MKEKKKTLFVLALLLLVGITSGYIANTYAKYVSEIKGNNGTATVAKWNFVNDNATQSLTIDLKETIDESTLVRGKIAPGTSGSFNVVLNKGTTETGIDYTIKLNDISNKPTNLKFYKDEAHTAESELVPGSGTITGQIAANAENGEITVPIYWAWKFGDSNEVSNDTNEADTLDGVEAAAVVDPGQPNPADLTIGVDITGVQTAPRPTT